MTGQCGATPGHEIPRPGHPTGPERWGRKGPLESRAGAGPAQWPMAAPRSRGLNLPSRAPSSTSPRQGRQLWCLT